ncbi:hypothetical protein A9HBioS_4692 [Pseudomonas koreensis]|uniref:Uncharacterized protein n=1 Tax=Pseudomonas koreensis TaxID=198620 RepID=A0AA94EKJ7_9PSED|nr:hypothetical protein A9HBioS_4692 [Pseudomonas koreensis]
MPQLPTKHGFGTVDYETKSVPVGESGGSNNIYTNSSPTMYTHYSHCICEPCNERRGNATGQARLFNQEHPTPPIYPE